MSIKSSSRRSLAVLVSPLLCALTLLALLAPLAAAEEPPRRERIGVMAFARGEASELRAVQLEGLLQELVRYAPPRGDGTRLSLAPLELRYDIGFLSKANLVRSWRHFNDAQRALERRELEDARGQLFRANLFYEKGVPFVRDRRLLTNIYYYRYRHAQLQERSEESRELYCKYVSLSRNLTGSPGTIAQYLPLQERCGETKMSGTGELIVRSRSVEGAQLYINNQPIATVSPSLPYHNPFMSAGVHLIELRRAGYTRWGKLLTLPTGASRRLTGRLRPARNRAEDYEPLASIPLRGEEAYSPSYLNDFLWRFTERFELETLCLLYLEPGEQGGLRFTAITYYDGQLLRSEQQLAGEEREDLLAALGNYWRETFASAAPNLDEERADQRWSPTIFRVD